MGVSESLNSLMIGFGEVIDIIFVLVILAILIIILKVIEKEYQLKLELKKKDRNIFYKRELNKIKETKRAPEKIIEVLNIVARGYFKEAFNSPYNLEYLELVDEFERLGKKECVIFCQLMSELAYSGDKIDEDKINNLLNLLDKIIDTNRILNDEERARLRKGKAIPFAKKQSSDIKTKENATGSTDSAEQEKTKQAQPLTPRKKDINYINWKYKLKIMILRLRGRLPEIRKTKITS
jgi:hypothetical protein